MPLLKGGRYTVPEKWENSAMGNYCFGTDNSTGKPVFIKYFKLYKYVPDTKGLKNLEMQDARTEKYRQRMERINTQVGQIARNGGDVVVTIDFFREGIYLYKVTEVMNLVPWKSSEVHERLSVEQIDALMLRAVSALNALHRANLLHCDLKPDNIFIVEQDGAYVGMVSDFDDSFFLDDIPCGGDVVGTPEYMSPELGVYKAKEWEQPDPEIPLTVSSDIFAMALIYHEYLTGALPDYDHSKFEQFWAVFWAENDEDFQFTLSDKLDAAHHELLARILQWPSQRSICTCTALSAAIREIQLYRNRKYRIRIIANGRPVANQTFYLFGTYPVGTGDDAGEFTEAMTSFTTDQNGLAVLKGLLPNTPYSVRLQGKQFDIAWQDAGEYKECLIEYNQDVFYRIQVLLDGAPVAAAPLKLYRREGSVGKLAQECVTDAQGNIVIKNLPQGEYWAVCQGVQCCVRWDEGRNFSLAMHTLRINVSQVNAPAVGKALQVYRLLANGGEKCVFTGATDSSGAVAFVSADRGGVWRVDCEGIHQKFTWPETGQYQLTLPGGTPVVIKAVLAGSTTPLEGVLVAFCKRREDGKAAVLKSGRTDIQGRAEMGVYLEGDYAVAVMETPAHYTLDGTEKVPYNVHVGSSRQCFTFQFTKVFVLERPEDVVSDQIVPITASKRYQRVIHYKDGSVLLVMRNGDQKTVMNNALALYGLEAFKR